MGFGDGRLRCGFLSVGCWGGDLSGGGALKGDFWCKKVVRWMGCESMLYQYSHKSEKMTSVITPRKYWDQIILFQHNQLKNLKTKYF